jgi:hypothetical protein
VLVGLLDAGAVLKTNEVLEEKWWSLRALALLDDLVASYVFEGNSEISS